jgi:minor extracellular serine protease Vpr
MIHKLHVLVASTLMGVAVATPVVGQTAVGTVDVSRLALAAPVAATKVDAGLKDATGPVEVVVRLAGTPLVAVNGPNAKRVGGALTPAQQSAHSANLRASQSATMRRLSALGAEELGRVRIAYNALIVRVDAAALQGVAAMPEVQSIRRVGDYEMDLQATVPYIGAGAVQNIGVDGAGITVAVLDSGIDYTHRNLGGAGTPAAYEAAYGTGINDPRNTTRDGLFPTSKVVAGYDFVGELWPTFGPRTEDPDPIDLEGHGTHVADIIAGRSTDGLHKGVAPGASLMAVKVCSAVSSSCNGVALLLGIDFALDPNGDGAMDDAADVINMSLGSSYGQIEDDLSLASANAVRAGVVVVASAGNSADRPYITGSPAATPEVISVAQTQVPSGSAIALKINSPANIAGLYPNTETVPWAPIDAGFTGDVVYVGRGCNVDPFLASPAGKVALVDRGACNISEKVKRVSDAGATGVLLGLVAAGDAVSFSNGGECPATPNGSCKPTLVIIQSYANLIKANIAAPVNVTVSPAFATSLAGSMVGSSSRGPNYSFSAIKPDIGAPGASVSAIAGTGTGTEPFGGTSGAAPMVAGAAALLLDAYPSRTPLEIKAMLMNRAETNVFINPATQPGVLAPITRIGGGEVRVDRAISTKYAAWDSRDPAGSLSFGFHEAIDNLTLNRRVVVRNFTNQRVTLPISTAFRYANDAASGAVSVQTPGSVTVPANGTATFAVQLKVDAAKLPAWNLSNPANQGNGSLLQGVEFDGYLTIGGGADAIRMPWHVLPAKSAAVSASTESLRLSGGTGSVSLTNTGVTAGGVDVFSLTGTSPRIGASKLPGAGDNFAVIDMRSVGTRLVSIGPGQFGVQFAINTFGERTHPAYPGGFEVQIDTNMDGNPDYAIYPSELTGFGATGQTVVNVFSFATGTASAFFFADADLNSGNMIMTAPLSVMGLTPSSKFTFDVLAYDNYFTGNVTDVIENMTVTLGTPRYFASGIPAGGVPAGGSATLTVQEVPGGATASPSQSGLLLLYRDARAKQEAQTITIR